jgi:hypothetical protein
MARSHCRLCGWFCVALLSTVLPGCFRSHGVSGADASVDVDSAEAAAPTDAGIGSCPDGSTQATVLSSITPRFSYWGRGVGDERFIFFRNAPFDSTGTVPSAELFLVRVGAERFQLLDRVELPFGVSSIESLEDDLAVYTTLRGGGLLDLRADRLTRRGTYDIGMPSREVARSRNRLWICAAPSWLDTVLFEYELPDLDSPRQLARGATAGCRSIVASSDGERAYVVDEPEDVFALAPAPSGPADAQPLGMRGEALHAGEGYLSIMNPSEIALIRESDFGEVGRLTGTFGSARTTTRGFEVYGAPAAHPDEYGLTVFSIDESQSPPFIEQSWEPLGSELPTAVARWFSHDDALRSNGRWFVLEPDAPHLREVHDPDLGGWPGTAIVQGRTVFLRDHERSVRIDVTDPAHPEVVSGGPHGGEDAVALERLGAQVALYGDANRQAELGSVLFERLDLLPGADLAVRAFDTDGDAHDLFTHALDLTGGSGVFERLYLAQPHLYQATFSSAGDASLRLQRWPIDDVIGGSLPRPAAFDRSWPEITQVGALARIHDERATAVATSLEDGSEIQWLSLETGETASFFLPSWTIVDLAVHGDRIFVIGAYVTGPSRSGDGIVLALERRGGELIEVDRVEWPSPHYALRRQVLSFDGRIAYAYFDSGFAGGVEGYTVMALRFTDLHAERGVYSVPAYYPVRSFIETDFGIVLSHDDGLHILSPWCE